MAWPSTPFYGVTVFPRGRKLPKIKMPPQAKPQVSGPLAEEAVRIMLAAEEELLERPIGLEVTYWPRAGLWMLPSYTSHRMPESILPVRLWKRRLSRRRWTRTLGTTQPTDD